MTLRFSTSDNHASSRDNLSWTASQFADSRQNPKNILSPDSSSFRLTAFPSLTAFLKTTYNKVARQLFSPLTVAQAQTATQYKILHNFFSRFLSALIAHCRARFFFIGFWLLCAAKSKRAPSKTHAKKFNKPSSS